MKSGISIILGMAAAVIVVVLIGVFVWPKLSNKSISIPSIKSSPSSTTIAPTKESSNSAVDTSKIEIKLGSPKLSDAYIATLSEDEKKVAELKLDSDTMRSNYDLFAKVARGGILNVTNCDPKPLVYIDSLNGNVILENDDTVYHRINVADMELFIAPKSTQTFTLKIKNGTGTYGYSCDGAGPKAVMIITP